MLRLLLTPVVYVVAHVAFSVAAIMTATMMQAALTFSRPWASDSEAFTNAALINGAMMAAVGAGAVTLTTMVVPPKWAKTVGLFWGGAYVLQAAATMGFGSSEWDGLMWEMSTMVGAVSGASFGVASASTRTRAGAAASEDGEGD